MSFSVVHGSGRLARSAGSRPKTRPVTSVSAEREQQDAHVGRRYDEQRLSSDGYQREQPAREQDREREARSAARIDSTRLSTSSCFTSRPLEAPSESRTAISFCRMNARAISRFATFAHAISSTSPTMHISTISAV